MLTTDNIRFILPFQSNDTEEQYKKLLAIPGVFGLMVINLEGKYPRDIILLPVLASMYRVATT
jgi:hypothetical protein